MEVVVVTLFELSAPNKSMTTADHCNLRRNVELRIEVVNRALPLAAPDHRVAQTKAWSERSALDVRHKPVIGGRPARFLGHIEPTVNRRPQVVKSTGTNVEICDGVGADLVVIADGQTLTAGILCAAIFAQTCTEGILSRA